LFEIKIKKNMQKRNNLITYIAISFGIVSLTIYGFSEPENTHLQKTNAEPTYSIKISQLPIPDSLTIFGEEVPIHKFDVMESLEKEILVNTYWQSSTSVLLKTVDRYFPIIEHILAKNNIPLDFKYLAVAESGLKNVVSPSGAAGYWQFLENTAKEYDLQVEDGIDERYDIEKSTEAACKYLKTSYEKFGSWAKVAASYNVGMNGLSRQLDYQHIDSYFDLYTNSETGRYVYRIIALKLIIENQEKYGYFFSPEDKYKPFKYTTYTIDSSITDLSAFAQSKGSNYKMLKIMNPWIKSKSFINPKGKSFEIKLIKEEDR